MKRVMSIPVEIIGIFILLSAPIMKLYFPELADFWLAVVAAIALFLVMHIRSYLATKVRPEQNPLP